MTVKSSQFLLSECHKIVYYVTERTLYTGTNGICLWLQYTYTAWYKFSKINVT